MKKLIPFFILSFLFGLLDAQYKNEDIIIAYAIGISLGFTLVPWAFVKLLSSGDDQVKHRKFTIVWSILLAVNLIIFFTENF